MQTRVIAKVDSGTLRYWVERLEVKPGRLWGVRSSWEFCTSHGKLETAIENAKQLAALAGTVMWQSEPGE